MKYLMLILVLLMGLGCASAESSSGWSDNYIASLSKNDCKGIASGDKNYCASRDCKGLAKKDASYCETSDCKGVAKRYGYIPTRIKARCKRTNPLHHAQLHLGSPFDDAERIR